MPNFRDRRVTDEDGNEFIFTVEVQRRLSQAGLPVEVASIDQLEPLSEASQSQPASKPETQSKSSSSSNMDQIEEPESIQIDPMTGKYVGRVKWYNVRKGYGFLLRGAGEEIFFHRSNAVGDAEDLKDGQWILYDVEETEKGPEATDIEPYEPQE
jgi:CspA family cold shock protein